MLEAIGLPFAPIASPRTCSTIRTSTPPAASWRRAPGKTLHVPALPLELDGERLRMRADPPRLGEHARELLASWAVHQEIESLATAA